MLPGTVRVRVLFDGHDSADSIASLEQNIPFEKMHLNFSGVSCLLRLEAHLEDWSQRAM